MSYTPDITEQQRMGSLNFKRKCRCIKLMLELFLTIESQKWYGRNRKLQIYYGTTQDYCHKTALIIFWYNRPFKRALRLIMVLTEESHKRGKQVYLLLTYTPVTPSLFLFD